MSSAAEGWLPPDPLLAAALTRWQRAAGRFWPYVCAVPFLGRLGSGLEARRPTIDAALWRALTSAGPADGTALVVDLPPARVLPLAPRLVGLGYTVVPVIQRWVARPAVLPSERLLGLLVQVSRLVRPARPGGGLVLLLDGERTGRPGRSLQRRTATAALDNRYSYRLDRFPPPELLAAAGIQRTCWLTLGAVASDLRPYADLVGVSREVVVRPGRAPGPA